MDVPGVRDADDVVDVAEGEFEQFVRHDAGCVAEAEQRVVGEDGAQAHRARVQDALVAQVAERGMSVDNLDLLADEDLPEQWEGAENCWKRGTPVDDPVR